MSASKAPDTQALPQKDKSTFNQIVKLYETKQYKKALKTADQILKKYPDHGETLAMKGLVLSCMNKQAEAYEMVKAGLKKHLTSHVCWHVYGLLYRADRNNAEALKSFKTALRFDPDNQQILRDLAMLQIHTRDIEGFLVSRQKLFELRPANKQNWISLAIGHLLSKNYELAEKLLDTYETTVDITQETAAERTELLLFKNRVIIESGQKERALENLAAIEDKVNDKLAIAEVRASLLMDLGRLEEAAKAYRVLIARNPEGYDYLQGLQKALGLPPFDPTGVYTPEQEAALVKLYSELETEFPKSNAIKRVPLDFTNGETFRQQLDKYARPFLRKTIPSLASDLKALYRSPAKVPIIEEVFLSFHDSLSARGSFPEDNNANAEAPSVLLWTQFFLASHFDRLGQLDRALEYINKAIEHTPTVIDLYVCKAKIYKHAGDIETASELLERARTMDLADRYLNTKSTRYLIRCDKIKQADDTISLFLRDGDGLSALNDLQCQWYENEGGESYLRQKEYGKALKKFMFVDKHFGDFVEDQYDFHSYAIRKMTLRAYLDLLEWEDRVYAHKFYKRAAKGIINTYIQIVDNPMKEKTPEEDPELAGLSPEERKKVLSKRKKAEARKAEETKAAADAAKDKKAVATPATGSEKPKDEDPDGEQLLKNPDPLGAALKFVRVLEKYAADDLDTSLLSFQVAIRKKKYLLALKAVKKAHSIAPSDPRVLVILAQFFNAVDKADAAAVGKVQLDVINMERESLLGGQTIQQLVDTRASQAKSHAEFIGAGESLLILGDKTRAVSLLTNTTGTSLSLTECTRAHALLGSVAETKAAEEYATACAKLFPLSTHFNPRPKTVEVSAVSQ